MIGWVLLFIFGVLAYLYSWWFLIVVAVLVLWKLNRWYFYSSRPWKRIHYPMMRAYAGAAGFETAKAQREGRDFDVRSALRELLRIVDPGMRLGHDALIEREFSRCRDFHDRETIRSYLTEAKGVSAERVAPLVKAMEERMRSTDKGLIVRMVIAAIIEERCSERDRAEYIFEVFAGRAK